MEGCLSVPAAARRRSKRRRQDPIVRNPGGSKRDTYARLYSQSTVLAASNRSPVGWAASGALLLICPNKRSLLDALVIGGHPFLSQPLFLPRCLLPPIGEIKNVAYRVTGLSLETDYCNLGNQLTVVWSIGIYTQLLQLLQSHAPLPISRCSAQFLPRLVSDWYSRGYCLTFFSLFSFFHMDSHRNDMIETYRWHSSTYMDEGQGSTKLKVNQ